MQPEIAHPGIIAVPAAARESTWVTVDRLASYLFAAAVLGGGMFVPLGIAVYSLFFK